MFPSDATSVADLCSQPNGKQVRRFREQWTKADAEQAMAAWLRGAPDSGSASMPSAALTLGEMIADFLEARAKSKRNRPLQDDRERSRPLLAYFGADTPFSAINIARVADYRLHRARMKSRVGRPL